MRLLRSPKIEAAFAFNIKKKKMGQTEQRQQTSGTRKEATIPDDPMPNLSSSLVILMKMTRMKTFQRKTG